MASPSLRPRPCPPPHIHPFNNPYTPPHHTPTSHSRHDLSANEAALKVGVDGACRLRRLGSLLDLPALDLVLTRGEEVNEVDGLRGGRWRGEMGGGRPIKCGGLLSEGMGEGAGKGRRE